MNSSPTVLINLKDLRCERDDRVLFEGLQCEINEGDVVQIKGPNGAGKTTLLRILLGLNPEYEGDVFWGNRLANTDLASYRLNLLYIGHSPAINRSLTPLENLQWFSGLSGRNPKQNLEKALAAVGLRGYEDIPGHHLSAGQHRRVALARLYTSQAKVWVLDEPFTAIDVQGVDRLRQLFQSHTENGGVVIITTHQDLGIEQVKILDIGDFLPKKQGELAK